MGPGPKGPGPKSPGPKSPRALGPRALGPWALPWALGPWAQGPLKTRGTPRILEILPPPVPTRAWAEISQSGQPLTGTSWLPGRRFSFEGVCATTVILAPGACGRGGSEMQLLPPFPDNPLNPLNCSNCSKKLDFADRRGTLKPTTLPEWALGPWSLGPWAQDHRNHQN